MVSLLRKTVVTLPRNQVVTFIRKLVVTLRGISKDLTIQFIDSVWSYDLDSAGSRIESSGKLTIKDQLWRIRDSGKLEKIR